MVSSRLRLAWQGEWGALWREAAAASDKAPLRAGRAPTPGEDARAVGTLVREGLLSKALGRVMSRAAVAVEPKVSESLQKFYPSGILPSAVGNSTLASGLRARLVEAAEVGVRKYPSRSGPGPSGSRFAHW